MMDVLSVLMSEEEAGVFVALDYIRQHFFFFFSVSSIGCKDNIFFVSIFNSSSNSSLMFVPCLAEVSMYLHFHILWMGMTFDHIFLSNLVFICFFLVTCKASPVFSDTSRLPEHYKRHHCHEQDGFFLPASSSHLLPTSIMGNPSRPPFT